MIYEPPAIEVLGSIEQLTSGKSGPEPDQGGSVLPLSDRALKEAVEPIDERSVLAGVERLDVSRWSYVTDGPQVRHIGPMAQDFAAAFDVGGDPRRIHPIDMNGVALAAIKALKTTVDRQQSELDRLRAELAELRDR